jgi:hypothetical protein
VSGVQILPLYVYTIFRLDFGAVPTFMYFIFFFFFFFFLVRLISVVEQLILIIIDTFNFNVIVTEYIHICSSIKIKLRFY